MPIYPGVSDSQKKVPPLPPSVASRSDSGSGRAFDNGATFLTFNPTIFDGKLPIIDYLDNREKMIEWLYKIHNKVNNKLRRQGLCHHKNPDLKDVKIQYKPIIEKINSLCNTITTHIPNITKTHHNTTIQTIINYICNLGKEFLGSIVFNYQGYFSNCHTQDEKLNIVVVYHTFFNSIIPLISSYLSKMFKECYQSISRQTTYLTINFKLKHILTQTEAYSKLIQWFYECEQLCTFHNQYETKTHNDNLSPFLSDLNVLYSSIQIYPWR